MKIFLDGVLSEAFDVFPTPRIVWKDGIYYRHTVENKYESTSCLLIKEDDMLMMDKAGKPIISNLELS